MANAARSLPLAPLRALLQQPIRRRNRRQDVYDIAHLLNSNAFDDGARSAILSTLIEKCRTRGIDPTLESLDDPEIRERAAREWETLRLEIANLPQFAEQFTLVAEFYRTLPWSSQNC